MSTLAHGDLMFKAEGLPFGTTFGMMKRWAAKIGWECQPVWSLGPKAMLLRLDRQPPGTRGYPHVRLHAHFGAFPDALPML